MGVIAEGIENPAQHVLLRELGCELGQGHLFSRPVRRLRDQKTV
jgi:EAL domain-containing protein (putative c-di-GMP-specific phosphodiesterase class I)